MVRYLRLLAGVAIAACPLVAVPGWAVAAQGLSTQASASKPPTAADMQILLQRIQQLEARLGQLQPGAPQTATAEKSAENSGPNAAPATATQLQAVLERLEDLDQRLGNLETTSVLSSPKTMVKEVRVWVDKNGNEFDHAVPGAKEVVTYQRERAYRRQTIEEEIGDAMAAQNAGGVQLGVNVVTTAQGASQTEGSKSVADGHAYGISAADITFKANAAALNTEFYADLVGIGGSPPDKEIPTLTLLNSQTARLSNNQLSVREAWIRTELFHQTVGVQLGRIDLTTQFDRNASANSENTQFISGALVNNPALGLASNGLGAIATYDPKGPLVFRVGAQQSSADPNNTAPSLSDSLYALGEVEYIMRPFGLPEGHYRLWGRSDNAFGTQKGWGLSADQKINAAVTLFARYGNGSVNATHDRMHFYSAGVQFGTPYAFHPDDFWGLGYARTDLLGTTSEKLTEAFYNLHLTEHMSASFMLQYVTESATHNSFLLPGSRLQVSF